VNNFPEYDSEYVYVKNSDYQNKEEIIDKSKTQIHKSVKYFKGFEELDWIKISRHLFKTKTYKVID
jgi:hypothetical protein